MAVLTLVPQAPADLSLKKTICKAIKRIIPLATTKDQQQVRYNNQQCNNKVATLKNCNGTAKVLANKDVPQGVGNVVVKAKSTTDLTQGYTSVRHCQSVANLSVQPSVSVQPSGSVQHSVSLQPSGSLQPVANNATNISAVPVSNPISIENVLAISSELSATSGLSLSNTQEYASAPGSTNSQNAVTNPQSDQPRPTSPSVQSTSELSETSEVKPAFKSEYEIFGKFNHYHNINTNKEKDYNKEPLIIII